eukprot:c11221_g1_i1.p1 GENE.c11221_g1_i1~~c11221_g1_i1.p1  ORF type:complete len:141 (-),score=46.01 c11221_g1_i1:114-536(-)
MEVLKEFVRLDADKVKIVRGHGANLLSEGVYEAYCSARKVVDSNLVEIKEHAESIKTGWGETILQQSFDILSFGKRKLEKQRLDEEKAREQEKEQIKLERQRKEDQRKQLQELERKARLAEKQAAKLIEEEERDKNRKKK